MELVRTSIKYDRRMIMNRRLGEVSRFGLCMRLQCMWNIGVVYAGAIGEHWGQTTREWCLFLGSFGEIFGTNPTSSSLYTLVCIPLICGAFPPTLS